MTIPSGHIPKYCLACLKDGHTIDTCPERMPERRVPRYEDQGGKDFDVVTEQPRPCHVPKSDCPEACPLCMEWYHQMRTPRPSVFMTKGSQCDKNIEMRALLDIEAFARGDSAPAGEKGTAKKMDVGKAPVTAGFMAYFAPAILAVAYVSEYGDRKYAKPEGPHYSTGWQQVQDGERRYSDADGRHRVKIALEGDYDAESEIAHLAHKAWNAMAELTLAIKSGRVEVRIGNELDGVVPRLGTFQKVSL